MILALSALLAGGGSVASDAPASVWTWNVQCGTSGLLIEVRLDGRSVHHAVVPICRTRPSQAQPASGPRPVSFEFTPTRALVWHGYRDREDAAAAGAPLSIELWQTSADANSLILGVTALDPVTGAVYVKTVHVAPVDQSSATEIARGLTLSSRPYRVGAR